MAPAPGQSTHPQVHHGDELPDRDEIKTVPHPPYSPDLAPCDFWMFPRLREKLRGRRFEDVEEIKEAVTEAQIKEAVTEALDTFTLEDYQRPGLQEVAGALQVH